MTYFNLPRARESLKKAVKTQGRDFVYAIMKSTSYGLPTCEYSPNPNFGENDPRSKTGCLVGTAFSISGVPDEVLNKITLMVPELHQEASEITMSKAATVYFHIAQIIQDRGGSWGTAYDEAEKWAEIHCTDRNPKIPEEYNRF